LKQIVAGESFEVVDDTGGAWRPLTDGRPSGPRFSTAAPGRFQAANAALALSAVRHLAPLGLTISDEAAARGLAAARLPGRLEEMPAGEGPRVILDAAHNPDKIAALASAVPTIIDGSEPPVVVFGALDGKAAPEMLAHLAPVAGVLVLTAPRVLAKPATPPMKLVEAARAAGFTGEIAVEPDPLAALDTARAIAGPTGAVLVTGSLYLVGNVRSRWYPDEAIVRERTPWPAAHR
jgi:dihydrofolate synthase/folylpolyglutamate synthase